MPSERTSGAKQRGCWGEVRAPCASLLFCSEPRQAGGKGSCWGSLTPPGAHSSPRVTLTPCLLPHPLFGAARPMGHVPLPSKGWAGGSATLGINLWPVLPALPLLHPQLPCCGIWDKWVGMGTAVVKGTTFCRLPPSCPGWQGSLTPRTFSEGHRASGWVFFGIYSQHCTASQQSAEREQV